MASAALLLAPLLQRDGKDVLSAAYGYQDGGGYAALSESGVSEDIRAGSTVILPRSKTGRTYCCGYTLEVALKVAKQRGLMGALDPWVLKRFQREWYGATADSRRRQAALALETLGIGLEVPAEGMRPGDFVVYSREIGGGHSVVLLEPLRRAGKLIGIRYRSSQQATDGVGDRVEYLRSSGYASATISDESLVACRLNSSSWW